MPNYWGDIDGVILGTIIPMIKKKPLSQILYEYYQGSGVDAGGRIFKAADRNATFGELLPDHELEAQVSDLLRLVLLFQNTW